MLDIVAFMLISVFILAFVVVPVVSSLLLIGTALLSITMVLLNIIFTLIKGIKDVLPQPRPSNTLEQEIQALHRLGKKPQR